MAFVAQRLCCRQWDEEVPLVQQQAYEVTRCRGGVVLCLPLSVGAKLRPATLHGVSHGGCEALNDIGALVQDFHGRVGGTAHEVTLASMNYQGLAERRRAYHFGLRPYVSWSELVPS